jgi:hypothetical protein
VVNVKVALVGVVVEGVTIVPGLLINTVPSLVFWIIANPIGAVEVDMK